MIEATTTSAIWNRDAMSISGLDIRIGNTPILSGVNLTLQRGDRVGLLGRNGCGKSTLFHWITSQKEKSPWSIYEVAQELVPTEQSIVQVVLSAHLDRGRLWKRQAELEELDDMSEEQLEEYNNVSDELAAMQSDADPPRVRKILSGLGFSEKDMEKPLSTFSGGWRARVALAQGLFMEPDLLLLDEPTNHLDLHTVLWLSEMCMAWKKTLIVISHNAGFLRSISSTVWYLHKNTVQMYRCTYDRFLRQRLQEEKKAEKEWESVEKHLLTIRKKGKKVMDEYIFKKALEGIVRPEKIYQPKFFFPEKDTTNSTSVALIRTENANLGYSQDHPILSDVSFALFQGSRVALVGANGSGKSTFLSFLEEKLPALNEDGSVHRRPKLSVCKFDQQFYHSLPTEKTPLQHLESFVKIHPETGERSISVEFMRKVLGASGLEGSLHTRPIGTLSGGQKARVYFATISVMAPDILLLDEPTNHLDMETIDGLRSALIDFPGAMVIVSHDVDFLEELATEVWLTEDGQLKRLGEGTDGLDHYIQKIIEKLDIA